MLYFLVAWMSASDVLPEQQNIDIKLPGEIVREEPIEHKVQIEDPFYELENESDIRQKWIQSHQIRTEKFFKSQTRYPEMLQSIKDDSRSRPFGFKFSPAGELYYWIIGDNDEQKKFCRDRAGQQECILNPNNLLPKGHVSASGVKFSPSGEHFLATITVNGTDANQEVRVYETETGRFLQSFPAWWPNWVSDHQISMLFVGRTEKFSFEERLVDIKTGNWKVGPYVQYVNSKKSLFCGRGIWGSTLELSETKRFEYKESMQVRSCIGFFGDSILYEGMCEDRPCVLNVKISNSEPLITPLVTFNGSEPFEISLFNDVLIAQSLVQLEEELQLIQLSEDGEKVVSQQVVKLPDFAQASVMGVKDGKVQLALESFLIPPSLWDWNLLTNSLERKSVSEPEESFSKYQVNLFYATSKDGTQVPFLTLSVNGAQMYRVNPTILYGYGGFGVSQRASFSQRILSFVDKGGVYVLASLRGGKEFGSKWYEQGQLLNRQNSFDDYIAVAEKLSELRISSPETLTLHGVSNGGVLVGAVVNQRPELFAAAVPSVGVMDMVRAQEIDHWNGWSYEYGDRKEPKDLEYILRYSPYHNIKAGVKYPFVMVDVGELDDRVNPAHSYKYAANLQHKGYSRNMLLNVEPLIGHGKGRRKSDSQVRMAKIFSLAFWAAEKQFREVMD